MALAPVQALMEARKKKELGDLNPVPFSLIINSQLGWTLYGLLLRDYYIFFSSAVPMVVSLVMSLTAIHLLERPQHSPHEERTRLLIEGVIVFAVSFWLVLAFFAMIVIDSSQNKVGILIVGLFSDVSSLIFYAFPLSLMWNIIKENDSSPLYGPAIFANLSNCILWFSYGVWAIDDAKVWVVNFLGAVLCILELVVWFNIPATHNRLSRSHSLYGVGLSEHYQGSRKYPNLVMVDNPNSSRSGHPDVTGAYEDSRKLTFAKTDLLSYREIVF